MKGQEVHMLPDLLHFGEIKISTYLILFKKKKKSNCYSVIKYLLFGTAGKPQLSIWIIKYNITNYFNLAFQAFKIGEAGK